MNYIKVHKKQFYLYYNSLKYCKIMKTTKIKLFMSRIKTTANNVQNTFLCIVMYVCILVFIKLPSY